MDKNYTFDPERFLPPANAKRPAQAYLIIGFDTEYQRESYVNDDGKVELRNRVLCYTYACHIIGVSSSITECNWSGIVYADGPDDEDRISLADFVKTALAAGFEAIPDLNVPSDVYLVAHFTRADVPGFSDFKDEAARAAMNLENVRNLFMNVRQSIDLDLKIADGRTPPKVKLKIRDTMTLAPTGAKSLAQLGGILGFEKLKLSSDPKQELYYKTHMAEFMEAEPELFREYAIRDAEICAQYTGKVIKMYCDQTGKFKLPVTLTTIGVDMIQNYWVTNKINPLEIVGKEIVRETVWSSRFKRNITQKKFVSLKKLFWNEDFFTECYHGGRNEQFWFGPGPEGVWYDYDLTSAYPSAMALIGIPDWSTIRHVRDTKELLEGGFAPGDLVYANVEFEFPDDVKYPVLPVRTENGLLFPRKGNSTTHISEILLAHKLGCKIELVEGRKLEAKRGSNLLDPDKPLNRPFEGFAKLCIDERRKHEKKTLDNLFWKELVNSTYGKLAQGLRERRIYNLKDAETKPLQASQITNPVYAAFITAFCRGVLGEIMNGLPDGVEIFSVTTDGFLTTATDQQMIEASGILTGYYLAARNALRGSEDVWGEPSRVYEIKHIIRQPLGWRTRGQATISPSTSEDWAETDIEPKEDEMVVLAKGGIKLDRTLSKGEQNDEIIRLFLDRKPTDTLTATLGAGIREMYEQGMDFVDKDVIKRLSMEFDWKRRPVKAGDVDVLLDGSETASHLAFSTAPWESDEQFYKVRELWERYNKDEHHCLKTRDDYDEFANYFEAMFAAEGEPQRWLSKTDGPLKRLRRDLVIAQNLRKAGTHQLRSKAFGREDIFPLMKLSAKDFAFILSEQFGIPCKKTDIDNARKYDVFKPRQVPWTHQTEQIINQIKREMFPYLEIDQFLTSEAAFKLNVADL